MEHDHVVIEDPTGARATVSIAAAPVHELRGFTVVGAAVAPGDPRTVDEAAGDEAAARAATAAVIEKVAGKPRPSTKAGVKPANPKEK